VRIDLHTHSNRSDGTDHPRDLVAKAREADIDVVALTDHDTTVGWGDASDAARALGIGLVPGIEISCQHEGSGVHLLAYLPDPEYGPLQAELSKTLDGRDARLPATIARLRDIGIDITGADVEAAAGPAAATGRPHVADALVTLGVVSSRTEAFNRYLGAGRPAYVDRYAPDLRDVLAVVDRAGGVSVVAHPWGRHGRTHLDREALAELRERGLVGLEVDHQDHGPEARAALHRIAAELDLVATGSSDYHGAGKADSSLGCNTTAPEQLDRLLEAARAAAARAGRGSPAVL
jgi:3',5'-nucleoside bisphosphate phosphatase